MSLAATIYRPRSIHQLPDQQSNPTETEFNHRSITLCFTCAFILKLPLQACVTVSAQVIHVQAVSGASSQRVTAWNKICSRVDIKITGCLLGASHYMISTAGAWIESNRNPIVADFVIWENNWIPKNRYGMVTRPVIYSLSWSENIFYMFVMHTVYLYM